MFSTSDGQRKLSSVVRADAIEVEFQTNNRWLLDWCVSDDGRNVAILWRDGTVQMFRLGEGTWFRKCLAPEEIDPGQTYSIRLSPSGDKTAFSGKGVWILQPLDDWSEVDQDSSIGRIPNDR